MSRRSRGCQRCRQRRVKCDQGRPACQRCLTRSELCVGYREEADLVFENETAKVILRNQPSFTSISTSSPSSRGSRHSRSQSLPPSPLSTNTSPDPWPSSTETDSLIEETEASQFLEKYVLYPCNESSSPGFLEHLPCLFRDVNVNVDGRCALRWAVRAASLADMSRQQKAPSSFETKAFKFYGQSLVALGRSLAERGKVPDDYDLMTVVVLDIFETLFMPDEAQPGSHAQGIAHILRLRGHEQFSDPRGWSLFRLAHHRLQKQQLAKHLDPLPESQTWLDAPQNFDGFGNLENDGMSIAKICHEANSLLKDITGDFGSHDRLLTLISQMHELDGQAATWRTQSGWSFSTIYRDDKIEAGKMEYPWPKFVEIHPDVWRVYEWNYHRTARIILHQQLLKCLDTALSHDLTGAQSAGLRTQRQCSMIKVQKLAESVLSTVPQSFGDIDSLGYLACDQPYPPRCQAIGAYLLLWPIKIIKGPESRASMEQMKFAQGVFERIRETTGMKSSLGDLSII